MMGRMAAFLLAGVFLFLTACSAEVAGDVPEGQIKTMRLANAMPDERSTSQALYKFGEIVEERTGGSIEVQIYTGGVLGGDRELLEGMQINTIQGATISPGPVGQFAPNFNVFELPFLFPDEEKAYKILDGPIGQGALAELEEQNIIGLNYWENGFRQLTNNRRKVESLEDIRGLNIRTLENTIHLDIWKKLGSNPTPININETYVALDQGLVNAQENAIGNVVSENFYEVQKYLTQTNHIYNPSIFMVSKIFWDNLNDEEKKIVKDAADEMRDYQRELNREETEAAYALLKKEGMSATQFSEEEKKRLREAVEPVYQRYRKTYGDEILSEIQAAVEAQEK